MKEKNILTIFITMVILCLTINFADGQWQPYSSGPINYGQTDPTFGGTGIENIGIGDFNTNFATPAAALDIVIPFLPPASGTYASGEAFHTTADVRYDHAWRMYEYNGSPGVEKFHILNYNTAINSMVKNLYPVDVELNVVQNGNMNFFTDNTQWMSLSYNGMLGISYKWMLPGGVPFTPKHQLHIHGDGSTNGQRIQITDDETGQTAADGFQLGNVSNHAGYSNGTVQIVQYEQAPMLLYNYNPTLGAVKEHLRFTAGKSMYDYENGTADGLRIINPGYSGSTSGDTAVNALDFWTANANSSHIRFGDKGLIQGIDKTNSTTVNLFEIKARENGFWFDAKPLTNQSSFNGHSRYIYNIDSAEVGRISPHSSATNWGFYRIGNQPAAIYDEFRRLEVYDVDTNPQFRITQSEGTTPRYTDFKTSSLGDLFIHPSDSVSNRRVGINIQVPITTLHVGGTAGSTGAITSDYLNHSYTPGLPGSNPLLVYSDANGTLNNLPVSTNAAWVLHGDGTWGAGGGGTVTATGCSVTPAVDFVTKFTTTTNICNSQIYDNGTYVDVGYTGAQPILNKLDVNGNINVPVTNSYNIWNTPFLKTNSNAGDVELGFGAGPYVTNTALYSVFIGEDAGYSIANSEGGNIFIGSDAGYHFVASGTGPSPSGGDYNVCVGYAAGDGAGNSTNGKGSSNVFLGSHAAGEYSNLNQYVENVVVGAQSGNQANDGGSDNVIIGYNSHIDNSSSTTGTIDNCVVIGYQVTSQSTDAFVCGNDANQILMGYNVTPSSVTSGGTYSSTSTDCKLYVNPRSTSTRQDAAYFNGNVLVSTNVYSASDSALKDNIQKLQETNAENLLKLIEPKTYTFNQAHPSIHLAPGLQYGLIAQEVEQVLPGLVTECTAPAILDSLGNQISPQETFKALNYSGFIPLLIASEKDHQNKIDSLKNKIDSLINRDSINNARMDQLEQMINACCSNPGGNATGRIKNPIDVQLGSENTIILNQNDPNPFAEQTRITYLVPADVKEAKIIFFDNSGHVMQTVTINDRGNGQINVYGEKLSSGIYSYSLLADGKVIDTKKMVCNK